MIEMLMQKQIAASILSQDQLVFSYRHKKDDGSEELVVRFATPIELDETMVKCYQHLPEQGYRNFKLDKIVSFNRVLTRGIPFVSIALKDDPTAGQKAAVGTAN